MKMNYQKRQALDKAIYHGLYAAIERNDCWNTVQDIITDYENGNFPRAERTKDLNMRFRWDCFHARDKDIAPDLSDLNDSHIDTALRRILPTIERKF